MNVAIFFSLSLLPALLYYGYVAFITNGKQAIMSFQPHLFIHKEYWRGWFDLSIQAVGATSLIAALLGMALLRKGWPLALLIGLWFGYFIFGLTFTYHIHTHDYYQAQLIPIVALSMGPVVSVISNQLKESNNKSFMFLILFSIGMLAMILSFRQVRERLGYQNFEDQVIGQEIGEIINHSNRAVYIARHYGVPLEYYGELTGSYWPRRITIPLYQSSEGQVELSVEERLNSLGFYPEYFVITDFKEYQKHHTDLEAYLSANCSILTQTDRYLIYWQCMDKYISYGDRGNS